MAVQYLEDNPKVELFITCQPFQYELQASNALTGVLIAIEIKGE